MSDKICLYVKDVTYRGESKNLIALANKMGIANHSLIRINDGADIRGVVSFMDKRVASCSDYRPNNDSVVRIKSIILDMSSDIIIYSCRRVGKNQDYIPL